MIQYYRARMEAGDKSAGYALAAFQISSALLIKKMERDQEHEADQKGMLIMARAGYHPDTPITVQQRAMRHGDIRVTMNYGDAVCEGLRDASAKVAAKAIPQ